MLYVSKITDLLKLSLDKNAFICYNIAIKETKQKEERKKNENRKHLQPSGSRLGITDRKLI